MSSCLLKMFLVLWNLYPGVLSSLKSEFNLSTIFSKADSTLNLTCPIIDGSLSIITWRGPPGLQIVSYGPHVSSKYSNHVTVEQNENRSVLILNSLAKHLEGIYQCETVNGGQAVEFKMEIRIAEPPNLQILKGNDYTSDLIQVNENSSLQLECLAVCGDPPTNLLWMRNTIILISTDQCHQNTSLVLEVNVTADLHMSNYSCIAENHLYNVERKITLHVNLFPVVDISYHGPDVVTLNANATLDCIVDTNTFPVDINWLFNGYTILNETSQTLILGMIEPAGSGEYTCKANNSVGTDSKSYNLTVYHQPLPIDSSKSEQFIEAVIGEPTPFELIILSFPEPECSWIQTHGAKLSNIRVNNLKVNLYALTSSVLVQNSNEFGIYKIRARNRLGIHDIVLHFISRMITTFPHSKSCNVSNKIVLTSNIDSRPGESWSSVWIHKISGHTVRRLIGVTSWNMSSLEINFCDYRDTGDYFCQWSSNGKTLTSLSYVNVTVYGPPICTSKSIRFITAVELMLTVFVYSIPGPNSVKWITDGNKANAMSFPNSKLYKQVVDVDIYGTKVPMEVYISSTIVAFNGTYSTNISCIFKNEGGNLDTMFTQRDIIKEWKLYLNSEKNTEAAFVMKYIFIIIAVSCLLVIVFLAGLGRCIIIFHKKRQGRIVVNQQEPDMNNEGNNQRPTEIVQQSPSEYEEIGEIPQETLYTDNDINTRTSPSTKNKESYMMAERNYLELVSEVPYEDLNKPPEPEERSYIELVPERPYTDLCSSKTDTNTYSTTTCKS